MSMSKCDVDLKKFKYELKKPLCIPFDAETVNCTLVQREEKNEIKGWIFDEKKNLIMTSIAEKF